MGTKKISELTETTLLDNDDVLPVVDTTNNITKKIKVGNLSGDIVGAPIYSSSSTYAIGDIVNYNGTIYECNTTISTAENWNSSHWTQTTIVDKIKDNTNSLQTKVGKNIQQGTVLAGATAYSDYIAGFCGFVVIHVFKSNFEYFYTGALSGSNKYAYKLEKILEYKYQGDANADCEIDTYNSPDTPNFHIKINNTGSANLDYVISLVNTIS